MLDEIEYTFNDNTYTVKQLPLGKSQEVLVKLLGLLGGDVGENALATLPSRVSVGDINFLRERLLGEHCLLLNESDKWVPMGKALVESHFAGSLGSMLHLLGKCLLVNFSDFLADLRLDDLAAEMTSE